MNKKYCFLSLFLLITFTVFGQVNRVSSSDKEIMLRKKEALKEFSNSVNSARSFFPNGIVRCATTERHKSLQNQKLAASDEAFERWLAPKVAEIKNKRAQKALPSVITLPVVIHIVHNGDAVGSNENISLAQALSQIQVFNEDFGKITGTPGDGAGVDTEIQFCLAQIDPNGNPTNGVVRHNLGSASFDSAGVEAAKAATIWDPTKYLNCWTFNFGGDLAGVLGYAQFPTGSGLPGLGEDPCIDTVGGGGGASTDGVVCAYDTWGSSSYASGSFSAPYDKGRTMTHEVGHMFGLRHIWGDGGCGVDDYCADTPLSDAANFGCPNTNSCTDTPIDYNDQVQNYMDYSDDTCMNMFTQDQKDRMIAVLMNSPRRDDLLVSTVCTSSVLTPYIQFKRQDCDFRISNEIIEGSDCGGYTELNIPLNIDKAPSANAVVTFAIDGTSVADLNDFQIMTPTVTFNSGSTADQNLVIRVLHDGMVETDEDLVITFTMNASGGDAVMNPNGNIFSIKILNDDSAPALTNTYNLIYEDFEGAPDWLVLDGDGDGRNWQLGSYGALDGFGTAPNTIQGACALSEKRLSYLGGTGNATPNNYFISPQITIPNGIASATLTYIFASYGATGGDYTVYFTTDISSAASINAGTVLQAASTIGSGASVLRTHNMAAFAGQTGYIVFRHSNNNGAAGLLLLDTVQLEVVKNTFVQTEIDNPTRSESVLIGSGSIYAYDQAVDNIIAGISNNSSFNYGCLSVEVDRSQTSVGAASTQFISPTTSDFIVSKTFYLNPTNENVSGDFDVTLYFTSAEITAWESATGRSRNELRIVKVSDNPVSAVNYSNFESYSIEEIPATISSFGTNITFTANFSNTGLRGGYALATTTGAKCGDFSTTWNGSSWSNGAPIRNVAATFTGNYTSSGDLEACSVTVSNNANITINPGHTLIIGGDVTVNAGSAITIENNAALRQIDDLGTNSGNIVVKRTSSPMIRLDYTAWSSPVSNQQLQAFSPNTVATRFYEYLYTGTTTPTAYQSVSSTNNFVPGKGYMIRVDNNWSPVSASVYNGQFTGVPFNGVINQSVGNGYNLLGNPYASPLDADVFLADNTSIGTLYFWTNTTPASGGVYPQNNFASYTTLGGAAAFASSKIPNGTIQTGQGFFVESSAADVIEFKNAQRVNASVSTQFYKSSSISNKNLNEKHRIWLNLNDVNTSYNQMLVGYMEGATNGVDNMIDGKVLDTSKPILYNVLNDEAYVIQGKALPFNTEDIIPLGLNILDSGNYNINIEQVDGLFNNQDVFLKDNQTGIVHDLKQGEYQFSSNAGTFKNRFELVFKNGALPQEEVVSNQFISVFVNSNGIQVNSSEKIEEIIVFDVLGRKLFESNQLKETQFTINSIRPINQALVVKVRDVKGNNKTHKIIY